MASRLLLFLILSFFSANLSVVAASDLLAPADAISISAGMHNGEILVKLNDVVSTPFVLEELSFTSDCGISDYELRYLAGLQQGAQIGAADIQKAISNLFKKNKFEKITFSLAPGIFGKKMMIQLTSFWTMYKCTISGLMRGKDVYRRLYLLHQGDLFDEEKHLHSVANIKKALCDDGYFEHELTEHVVHDAKTKEVSVNLKLKRGERYYVDSVELITKSDGQADQDVVAVQEKIYKKCLSTLQHKYFSVNALNQSVDNATHLVEEEGFFDAALSSKKKIDESEKTVGLRLMLDLRSSKHVCMAGNSFFSRTQLFEHLAPFTKSFSLFPVAVFIEELGALYHDHGFLSADIRAIEDNNRIAFVINEGPRVAIKATPLKELESTNRPLPDSQKNQVNFGKTIVRGHLNVPFEYIERELHYRAGEPWDKEKLKSTVTSLRALDMFENLYVHPDNASYIEDEKAVLINVEPAPLYELLLRGGAGLQKGGRHCWFGRGVTYTLGGSLVMRNVTNHADSILFNADIARGGQTVTGSYTVPWLWKSPTRTTLKGYLSNIDHPAFLLDGFTLYSVRKEGLLLSFQRHFEGLDCHLNMGFEWLKLGINCYGTLFEGCVDTIAVAYDIDPCMLGRRLPYFFVEPTLVFSYAGSPVEGAALPLTFLSAKIVMPAQGAISDTYFIRFLAEQTFYYPIGCCIGALRGRLGYIFSPCFARVNPLDRFYCGGPNSIRSYEFDMCPPYGLFNDIDGCCRTVPQGGKAVAIGTAELRFPIYGLLSGVLFQDIGTLAGCGPWRYENNLLLATGFGLRYQTPIGPLSFDIGWKWAVRPSESCYAWFLSLGSTF